MLLIKSSKLSMPKSFSMSIIWKILTGLLLSLRLTFTALFQNQVEWILPAFFSWWHLYASWWFSWHILSGMKSLPESFGWHWSLDLFQKFFLLTSTLCLSFLHLNFTITNTFFFKRWQAFKSSHAWLKKILYECSVWTLRHWFMEGHGLPPLILAYGTEHYWLHSFPTEHLSQLVICCSFF